MKIICIIPARLDSTRFPRKLVTKAFGTTLLGHVIEAAKKVSLFDEVIVACCSKEIATIAKEHGVKAILTDPNLNNGTKRMIAAIDQGIVGDFFVNWQGDEPFITESVIKDLIGDKNAPKNGVYTLKKKITKEEAQEESVVKVVTGCNKKALYFSRSLIPFERNQGAVYYKHVGLYGFCKNVLKRIETLDPSPLEESEVLEQLGFLENGIDIHVNETFCDIVGIDTKDDFEAMIEKMSKL